MTNRQNLNCHSHAQTREIFYKKQKCSIYFIWSILSNLNMLGNYFLYGAVGFSVTFIYLVVSLSVLPLFVYANTSVISEPEIV